MVFRVYLHRLLALLCLLSLFFIYGQKTSYRGPASAEIEIPYLLIDPLYLHTRLEDKLLPELQESFLSPKGKIIYPVHPNAQDDYQAFIKKYGGIAGYLKAQRQKSDNKYIIEFKGKSYILELTLNRPSELIRDQRIRANFAMNRIKPPEFFKNPITPIGAYVDESENLAFSKGDGDYAYQHGFMLQKRPELDQQIQLEKNDQIQKFISELFSHTDHFEKSFQENIEQKFLRPYLELALNYGVILREKKASIITNNGHIEALTTTNWNNNYIYPVLGQINKQKNTFLSGTIQKDFKLLKSPEDFVGHFLDELEKIEDTVIKKNKSLSKKLRKKLAKNWQQSLEKISKELFRQSDLSFKKSDLVNQLANRITRHIDEKVRPKKISEKDLEVLELMIKHKIEDAQVIRLLSDSTSMNQGEYYWSAYGIFYQDKNENLNMALYSANEQLNSKGKQQRFVLASIDDLYAGQSFLGANSIDKSRRKYSVESDYTFPVIKAGTKEKPFYMLLDGHHRVNYLHHYENYQKVFLVVVTDITHHTKKEQEKFMQSRAYFWSPDNPTGAYKKIKATDLPLNPLRDLYDLDKLEENEYFKSYTGHNRQAYKQIDYARNQYQSNRDLSALFENYQDRIKKLPLHRDCPDLLMQLHLNSQQGW